MNKLLHLHHAIIEHFSYIGATTELLKVAVKCPYFLHDVLFGSQILTPCVSVFFISLI